MFERNVAGVYDPVNIFLECQLIMDPVSGAASVISIVTLAVQVVENVKKLFVSLPES